MRISFAMAAGVSILPLIASGCASHEPVPVASGETIADMSLNPIVITVAAIPATVDTVDCRDEQVTGTHQDREVCLTRSARAAQRRAAQEFLRSGGFSGGGTDASSLRSGRRTRTARRR